MLSFNKVWSSEYNGVKLKALYTEFQGYRVIFIEQLPTVAAAMLTYFDLNQLVIGVSIVFMDLPETTQEFLLHHEIAHIKNGDIKLPDNGVIPDPDPTGAQFNDSMNKYMKDRVSILDIKELKADQYACDIVGSTKSIEALNTLREYVIEMHNITISRLGEDREKIDEANVITHGSLAELDERIRYIKENIAA